MSENEIFITVIIAIAASVAGSFVGGTILGNYISGRIEAKKETKELDKIRFLLSHDFSRIFYLCRTKKEQVEIIQNKLQDASYAIQFVNTKYELRKLIEPLVLSALFVYWKTLETNSSLIKLEPREIQILQASHDNISAIHENTNAGWLSKAVELEKYVVNASLLPQQKVPILQQRLKIYFETFHIGLGTIATSFAALQTIGWLDLNAVLKTSDQLPFGISVKEGVYVDEKGAWDTKPFGNAKLMK